MQTRPPRKTLFWAAGALALAVAAWAGFRGTTQPAALAVQSAPATATAAVAGQSSSMLPTATAPAGTAPSGPAAPTTSNTLPPGVTAEQWQQLVAEMATRPDGAAELARLAEYFHFSDALQRFRQLRRQSASGAELAALARTLDDGLDVRLQRREVSGAEARAIKLAVLEVLLPDDNRRQATLQQWQAAPRDESTTLAAALSLIHI